MSAFGFDLAQAALAFRGYNVTNLGRTRELLLQPAYQPIVAHELERFSRVCHEVVGTPVNLIDRVEKNQNPGLEAYAEAIALIVAVSGSVAAASRNSPNRHDTCGLFVWL